MSEKPNIEVTLLSREEIEEKSKVLQKIGPGCKKIYWTSDTILKDFAGVVDIFGYIHYHQIHYNCGVRPVLKTDSLYELIKNCPRKFKNGIQIIELGTYPDLSKKLNVDYSHTFKPQYYRYHIPAISMIDKSNIFQWYNCQTYIYNNQEIIKLRGCYYPLKPAKFYVDRENNMLISVGVLFESPINVKDSEYNNDYDNDFKNSQLYRFLNKEFIKDLLINVDITDKEISKINISEDENYMQTIISENESLKPDIQRKKELLEKLKELTKENEALRLQNKKLNDEIDKIVLDIQNHGHQKTLHL